MFMTAAGASFSWIFWHVISFAFLAAAGALFSARMTVLELSDMSCSMKHDNMLDFAVRCLPVATRLQNILPFALSELVF